MPPAVLFLKNRFAAVVADRAYACQIAALVAIHLAALAILIATEAEPAARAAFVLTWGLLNCAWLTLLRRPLPSAALSLAFIVVLILLSQFKHNVLLMTATFVDVMLIDFDTFTFLMTIFPGLAWKAGLGAVLTAAVLILLWRFDPFRVRRLSAAAGGLLCLAGLTGLSFALPTDREDEFGRAPVRVQVHALGGGRGHRPDDAGGAGCRCDGVRPDRCGRRDLPSCRQAAAYRHGVR